MHVRFQPEQTSAQGYHALMNIPASFAIDFGHAMHVITPHATAELSRLFHRMGKKHLAHNGYGGAPVRLHIRGHGRYFA
ncbi:MAG TPA: hypothetical protein PK347_14005 [Burkholderiaceae bacterium]|nr:hypothetical protein [Burkholderiaceae bacterium]